MQVIACATSEYTLGRAFAIILTNRYHLVCRWITVISVDLRSASRAGVEKGMSGGGNTVEGTGAKDGRRWGGREGLRMCGQPMRQAVSSPPLAVM